ncbi:MULTISPECIES: serine/threonine-protein kinase [Nostocales]|nr:MULTISPECIES: serine/threonine-protein kinase [Nostocales]
MLQKKKSSTGSKVMPPVRFINNRYALSPKPRSGGMADVYRAIDYEQEELRVAVKLFKHGQLEGDILEESFRRETQALKELKHPGIVELLDSGKDESTGEYFLVLEWMEKDLATFLKESPPEGWDYFWQAVALPVLEALAFSHNRNYIHRDIKPNNILISSDGKPKLADFGISKLRSYFQPSVTLREFVSRPFTPPEADDGSYPYTRDVFSFGVLVLKCLTDAEIADYNAIPQALAEFDAPPEIVEVIERAVSRNPAERPHNAEVLLAEINAIQQKRSQAQPSRKRTCYLQLTNKALNNLRNELQVSERQVSENEIEKIILEDLNSLCGISPFKQSSEANTEQKSSQYSIFGSSYRYHIAAEKDCLVIINAQQFSSAILEQNRDRSWVTPYEFKFGKPLIKWEAEEVIREIKLQVETHEANLRQTIAEQEKQRLFRIWSDILRAKKDWEKNREKPIKYTSFTRDGNRIKFQISELPENDIAGQPRHITRKDGFSILVGDVVEITRKNKFSILEGEVSQVTGDELVLYVKYGQPDKLPKSGELVFDTRAAETALSRQKYALDAIRFDRAVRADMRQLLVNSQEIRTPEIEADIQFFQSLNESQQEVVKAALATQDFLIVQGPPGTGKTTFITEIILQTLKQNSNARILLSSQTHVALDNALERIQTQNSNFKLVRLGNHERVSENVHSLLLEEQMEKWREQALATSKNFIAEWSAKRGVSPRELEKAILFQELKTIFSKLEDLRTEVATRKEEIDEILPTDYDIENPKSPSQLKIPKNRVDEFQRLRDEIEELRQQQKLARDEQKIKAKRLQELTEISTNELLKLNAEQLEERSNKLINPNATDAKIFQQLISIQAEWFDCFGRNDKFNTPLIKRSAVVAGTCIGIPRYIQDIEFDLCIVDEASKATATEVLVPMSRSHRWILVGDTKQLPPFQDEASRDAEFLEKYELTQDDIRETLFDRLLRTLPEGCCKMLEIQHRMVAPIGNLISECFYEGNLQSARTDVDKNLIEILPQPVTWLTTSNQPNYQEQSANSSFSNICEVNVIVQLLHRLNKMASEAGKNYNVAVLSGYSAQLKLLNRGINAELNNWKGLTIECDTVDAFQGREADIAVYSITRSNKQGKIGFLRDEARLNVALSRGKVGLVIVGDHYFCRTSQDNPLYLVLDYIERHPENCALIEAVPSN